MLRHKPRNDFFAFTLSEVLITLGIIGVVAALTLGVLIPNFEKQRNLNVLKKAYSEMQNYVLDFKQDSGCIDIKSCWPDVQDFYLPFAEYLIEKKGFKELWPYDSHDYYSYGKSASKVYLLIDNKRFGNKEGWSINSPATYPGEFPRAGKDLFIFHIHYDGKFVPEGAEPYTKWIDNDSCNPDNTNTSHVSGFGCLGRIIEDGWQIKYKW